LKKIWFKPTTSPPFFTYLSSAQCWSTVQWFGTTVFPRLIVKVSKPYSVEPSVSSILLPLACHIFAHWAMPKFHLFTLVVKMLISVFRSIFHPSSCILSLLPPQRDSTITSRLRSAAIYPQWATRTKRFTFSVQYFLLNYQ